MKAFGFELKQAVRRVFTWQQTGAIMIPAIGLALATIMFAVGWSYSSLSLPYKDAGQLVIAGYVPISTNTIDPLPRLPNDIQPFFDWKERKDVFTDVAAVRDHRQGSGVILIAKAPGGNLQLALTDATVNYFDVLGVSFPGIQAWKTSLGSQSPIPVAIHNKTSVKSFAYPEIGQTFQTHDGKDIAVNGILPANFVPPTGDINENGIVPFDPKPGDAGTVRLQSGLISSTSFHIIGRLAPGMTPHIAEQILAEVSGGEIPVPLTAGKFRLTVRPVTDILTKSSRSVVWGAWALGALTLLLCTANLAGLMLTRSVYRLREYAMRSALGARFSSLLRMMLMEVFLLCVVAAFFAAVIAHGAIPAIAERIPIRSAAFGQPVFNWETMLFLIIATLFVAVASGLFSVVALIRNYYKGFSQGIFAVFHSHRIPRILLTVSQTAIAAILLCLSWMTVRGYLDIYFRDPGVDTSVRIVEVKPSPSAGYAFVHGALEALRGGDPNAQIGVINGNVLTNRPNTGQSMTPLSDGTMSPWSDFVRTSPGLFKILKVEILAGRDFIEQDRDDVVLINESWVRQIGWPVREAIGKQFINKQTVIGVVRDFPASSWDGEVSPLFIGRLVSSGGTFSFIIHPDAAARAGNVERTILRFDPDAVITRNATWGELLGDSVRGRTFATFSVTLFTFAAIAIVVIGIVSTITFIVARRTRDIAIQIAIGAPSYRVCWFVVKDMVIAGVIGALIGMAASWWAGKAVAHYIYNGEKYQNLTGLAVAAAIMLAIIAAAALLPALRATRIEPGRILNMG